jgi:hypothetical protein
MQEEPTTAIIQRYLDALPGDPAAEPIIRELLDRAVGRLRHLCAAYLYRRYPRLARPPVNLETDLCVGEPAGPVGLTCRHRELLRDKRALLLYSTESGEKTVLPPALAAYWPGPVIGLAAAEP